MNFTRIAIVLLLGFFVFVAACGLFGRKDRKIVGAAGRGDTAQVERLIEKGVDVNTTMTVEHAGQTIEGVTALHVAAEQGHVDIVKLLIENGADLDAGVTSGQAPGATALHMAAEQNRIEAARILIENGADLNAAITAGPIAGATPLDFARHQGHGQMIELLTGQQ